MADSVARAREFMLLNARVLERRLFAHRFEGGGSAPVVAALLAYQNEDGGFGNALEPDKRAPPSQPQDAEIALRALDAVDALSPAIAEGVCNWLSTVTTEAGGVPYTLPSANAFPHAPWWGVSETTPPANLNPTAAILGLLMKHGCSHPWLKAAESFCWQGIEGSDSTEFHELICTVVFLQHAPDRGRGERELGRMVDRVASSGAVALDPDAEGYVQKPLDFAPEPSSPFRRIFSDAVVSRHLAALAARQQADGGWPLNWDAISPGVEMECRGRITLASLSTLQAYGA